jgi:tRNA (Thr-GGU) A37 N-methylase
MGARKDISTERPNVIIMTMVKILSQDIKALILDIDGVIWNDEQPIGNLP